MAQNIFKTANTMNSIVIDDYNIPHAPQVNELGGYVHVNEGVSS